METMSSSSQFAKQEASTCDEIPMEQSLLFLDSLKDLKNLRSQLYSAAEYFELSYTTDDQKQIVVNTLKDYAVKALVNTVDHLGSVSHKVNDLIEKVDQVSHTELQVSCIEQRLRTCQEYIGQEGLSQQSLVITAPKYHKQYILPGDNMPGTPRHVVAKYQELNPPKEDINPQKIQAEVSTIRGRPASFRKPRSQRAHSSSPSPKVHFPSPSPGPEKRAVSSLPTSYPVALSVTNSSSPTVPKSSNIGRRSPSEPHKSAPTHLQAERNDNKEIEHNLSKSRSFLKALLSRRSSRKNEMSYS